MREGFRNTIVMEGCSVINEKQTVQKTRFDDALSYTIDQILNWKFKSAISAIYLYGSCARNEQNADSDVDLFIELLEEVPNEAKRQLKVDGNPDDFRLPDVELKFGMSGCLDQEELFYKNIKRDGVVLWKKQ